MLKARIVAAVCPLYKKVRVYVYHDNISLWTMSVQYVSRLFFLKYENVTWIQYITLPFKRDVRVLKHLIELSWVRKSWNVLKT